MLVFPMSPPPQTCSEIICAGNMFWVGNDSPPLPLFHYLLSARDSRTCKGHLFNAIVASKYNEWEDKNEGSK